MQTEIFHISNIENEKVSFSMCGSDMSPSSSFMLACKWYLDGDLTRDSKLLMDRVLHEFVLSRQSAQ